jgi:hypothetical protein
LGVSTPRHVSTAPPYDCAERAARSTQTSAIGNVSLGQRSFSPAAVTPPRRPALRAYGTAPSRDSRIWRPVSVLWRSFLPAIVRSLIELPLSFTAA